MNIGKSSLKLFLAKVGTALITFIMITYFARTIGAEEMGKFFLFQSIIGVLSILSDFGLRVAVEKRISEGKDQERYLTSAVIAKSILLLAVSVVIILLRTQVNQYIGAQVSLYLVLALIGNEFSKTFIGVLKGELRVGETAILHLLEKITWASLGMILILFGFVDAEVVIIAFISGFFISSLIGFLKTSTRFGRPSWDHALSLANFGKYSAIGSTGGFVYNWMDIVILGLFVNQSLVGAYEMAWRVAILGTLLSQAIRSTIFPKFSELASKNKTNEIESLMSRWTIPSMYISIPLFLGAISLSREVLKLLFGEEYVIAWAVLIILTFEQLQKSFYWILVPSLYAVNRPDLDARSTLVGICINLILNVVLVWKFGIIGAAVATAVASISITILQLKYVNQFFSLSIPYYNIGWCLVSGSLMTILILVIKSTFNIQSIYALLTIVGVGAMVYFVLTLLKKEIRSDMINIISDE